MNEAPQPKQTRARKTRRKSRRKRLTPRWLSVASCHMQPESRARVFQKPNCAATCSAGHEFIGATGAELVEMLRRADTAPLVEWLRGLNGVAIRQTQSR